MARSTTTAPIMSASFFQFFMNLVRAKTVESSLGKQRSEPFSRHFQRFAGSSAVASHTDRIRDSPEHHDYSCSVRRNRYCSRNMQMQETSLRPSGTFAECE